MIGCCHSCDFIAHVASLLALHNPPNVASNHFHLTENIIQSERSLSLEIDVDIELFCVLLTF